MLVSRFAASLLLASSIAFFPSFALGQMGSMVGSQTIFTVGNGPQEHVGAPYSAQLITTQVQTLADGTQITRVTKQFHARDSQGRMRTEMYLQDGEASTNQNANQPAFISISDPVGRQIIHLDARRKLAIVTAFPALPQHLDSQGTSVRPVQPVAQGGIAGGALSAQPVTAFPVLSRATGPRAERLQSDEKLPSQTIDGVYVEGHRITRVIPAGTQGNNRDITVVTETWSSPDLKILVLSKTSDPRIGERTMEIKDLSRDEPAPELFQVPADYKVETAQQNQR